MVPCKVIVGSPPLDMQGQLTGLFRSAPRAARQQSHTLPARGGVRFSRSTKAVLSRPDKPAAFSRLANTSKLPHSMTRSTFTSRRRRWSFFTWP
jgi:hypothetical protein